MLKETDEWHPGNRYVNWAKEAGLDSNDPELFAQQHKDRYTVINTAIEIIAQICDLTTEATNLEKLYGLQLKPQGSSIDPDDAALAAQKISLANGAAVLWSAQERRKREDNLLSLQKRISHLRRLKWAIRDKAKFEELHEQLKSLNDGLRDILPRVQQNNIDRTLLIDQSDQGAILELLVNNEAFQLASQDYVRAAKVKYLTLQQEGRVASTALRLEPAKQLDCQALRPDDADKKRGLATFDGERVLFEVKTTQETDQRILDIIDQRIQGLVSLLQISPKPSNFRVLDCKGYLRTPGAASSSATRYGLVFALPDDLRDHANTRVQTLHSILRPHGDNRVPVRFPLDTRFQLAARLATSVLQLHEAKWLHHNVTSGNIICLSSSAQDADDPIGSPYLSGFDLARFDDPREVSEIAARDGDNSYRHPEYQISSTGAVGPGRKYSRSYELYSLGVVLAEIGLWRQAEALRPPNSHAAAFARHLKIAVVPMLAYYMGKSYADAVLCCLETERLASAGNEKKLSEAFSRRVVAVLEGCRA